MLNNALTIEYRNTNDLKPYLDNPHIHSRRQLDKLKNGLGRFGQITPIIIDRDDTIVDGEAVWKAWTALGAEQIAVIVAPSRDEAEIRAIRLALNRIPEEAGWDKARLKLEFEDLLKIGFDMDLTGFDTVEIDMALAIDEPGSGALEDAPPGPGAGPAMAQAGDIWILGRHRLACGDCRDVALTDRLMAGATARMSFADPPYNVVIDGNAVGKGRHREFAFGSGEMSTAEFTVFLAEALLSIWLRLVDGGVAFCCMDWRHVEETCAAARAVGFTVINLCVWTKTNPGMGSLYRSQHELVFVLKKGEAPHVNNVELGKQGRSRSNVWTYRGMSSFGADRDELLGAHPTVKPVALAADAIKDVSGRGDLVFDPFLGSGTTLIAAHRTGRRCFGVELDPLYVDVILSRWEAETGREPQLPAGTRWPGRSPRRRWRCRRPPCAFSAHRAGRAKPWPTTSATTRWATGARHSIAASNGASPATRAGDRAGSRTSSPTS
ncbi:MAG: DNA modification methylase [Caulobacterales bacterium]